jgi:DNA-binding transcriptional LysR family regulator
MDIKNLEILLVLDDEKHFKRASEKLNISQPALSMKLKSLENEIGVTLVKRGKNFMGLTSEGKVLKNRFSNIVKEYSEIKQLSSELKNSLSGTLRIGVIPTAQLEIANIINFFVQKHKNVNTKVISMPSSKIDEQLHDYKIDIGITYLENEPIKGVTKIPFYDERYFLISSNQKFKTKKTVRWSDCQELDLCLLSDDNQFRRIINTVFKDEGISPRVLLESNSVTQIFSQINMSNFSTIMPFFFTQAFNYRQSAYFSELITPTISHKIGLVFIKDTNPAPLKDNFIKFAKSFDK